jgi:RNA polymerase sigma-70 factor, ECF subfamily
MSGTVGTAVLDRADVERAARGDEVAFARLVALHNAEMLRIAQVILGDAGLAQDAVQSAWVTAWRKLGSVRDPGLVRPWLVAVAANEARATGRRQRRVSVTEIDVETPDAPSADPAWAIPRLDLVRALAKLTPDDRALLALRYVAGFEAGELERVSHLSPSATRTRLSRLTARLREELER